MKVFGMSKVAVALLVSPCGVAALASPPESGYHLIKKVPLGKAAGGAEYFDYITVDAEGRRIYVSHGSEVKVLDADDFEETAVCPEGGMAKAAPAPAVIFRNSRRFTSDFNMDHSYFLW